jgi:hypothetical protein
MTPEQRLQKLERKMLAFDRIFKASSTRLEVLVPVTMRRPLTVNGVTIHTGNGSPEAVVTAPIGSIFLQLDGGSGTTLYVKESGTGNTGWSTTA